MRRILPRKPYVNFIRYRYVFFAISMVIIIVAAVALFTRGLNFGIDFTGGFEVTIQAKAGTTIAQVRGAAGEVGYPAAQIQQDGTNKEVFLVRVPKISDTKQTELKDTLTKDVGAKIANENFVGPGWGSQVSQKALIAVLIFVFAVLVYVSLRFEFKMAVTAIIEVVHDLIITVGVYALSGRQVTPATVIAVLTILGYSLYDTIVIFDRIKENTDQLTRSSKKTYSEVVNDSVNQVFARSINTSLTVLIPIVCILIFGGATLSAFAFALFVGVLAGTYSSIILAPPILSMWKETEPKYKAFRERADRAQAREAKVAASGEVAAVMPKMAGDAKVADKAAPKGPQKAAGKKPAARKAAKPAPAAKQATSAEEAAPSPKPQPKPKPAAGKPAAQTSKAAARNRTKGPGGGKKKKKKK